MTEQDTYNVEYTDTSGGEANYSWVRRETISVTPATYGDAASRRKMDRRIMRLAKAAVGLTGVRGVTESYGDVFRFRPYGSCTVMFCT